MIYLVLKGAKTTSTLYYPVPMYGNFGGEPLESNKLAKASPLPLVGLLEGACGVGGVPGFRELLMDCLSLGFPKHLLKASYSISLLKVNRG